MLVKPADTRARRLLSSPGTGGNFGLSGDMFILTELRLFRFRAGSHFALKNVKSGKWKKRAERSRDVSLLSARR